MEVSYRAFNRALVAKRLARHFACGRSRVLTPVPPDLVWVFFRGFPTPSHRGMSTGLISLMRQMLGQYKPLSNLLPIITVSIQNLPVTVAEMALESLSSSPPPFGDCIGGLLLRLCIPNCTLGLLQVLPEHTTQPWNVAL
ncbi:hypothetical protein MTP99_000664 [Tenebrio molitor]|nr:hypothetical protein MTP99_000664 [Tenebrio molitor]